MGKMSCKSCMLYFLVWFHGCVKVRSGVKSILGEPCWAKSTCISVDQKSAPFESYFSHSKLYKSSRQLFFLDCAYIMSAPSLICLAFFFFFFFFCSLEANVCFLNSVDAAGLISRSFFGGEVRRWRVSSII